MKRSNASYKNAINQANLQELFRKTAIHEAGHAVGIYLGNQTKQLPPVYFKIVVRQSAKRPQTDAFLMQREAGTFAKIEGGRIIHSLPPCYAEAVKGFSPAQQQAYQKAFEADMVNFLMGSMAEAHYVALRDGNLFHPSLVSLTTLGYCGGLSDLAVIDEYLECWLEDPAQRQQKIADLILEAFHFVSAPSFWFAINTLAHYILTSQKDYIDCEEAITVIESGLLATRKTGWA